MRVIRLLLGLTLFAIPVTARMPQPKEALDGIDPVVLLTQGKEVSGKPEFKVTRGKFDYLFASAESKASFEKTPEKYEVQLSGACARMGAGVLGNPADYAVVDGKIYIFGSDECHKKFVAAPAKYLPKPVPPMPTASADLQAGRALIEKAVKALGGAEKIDAITTYVETASQTQKRAAGEAVITVKTMRRFPGDVRVERTMSMGGRTQSTANLLTADGAWFIGQGRAFPQSAEGRAAADEEYGRHLVALLRARRAADFKAAALVPGVVDGVSVDRVRVKNGFADVTLNLGKASGQVHSLTFTGRTRDAEIGEVTLVLSDYREVGGLRLPFAERALFNGAPDEFLTRKIESIAVNAPLDGSLFETPRAGGQ